MTFLLQMLHSATGQWEVKKIYRTHTLRGVNDQVRKDIYARVGRPTSITRGHIGNVVHQPEYSVFRLLTIEDDAIVNIEVCPLDIIHRTINDVVERSLRFRRPGYHNNNATLNDDERASIAAWDERIEALRAHYEHAYRVFAEDEPTDVEDLTAEDLT